MNYTLFFLAGTAGGKFPWRSLVQAIAWVIAGGYHLIFWDNRLSWASCQNNLNDQRKTSVFLGCGMLWLALLCVVDVIATLIGIKYLVLLDIPILILGLLAMLWVEKKQLLR